MLALPIDSHLPELARSLSEDGCAVLLADPGAGKTTRVPPAVIAHGVVKSGKNLVMLQPRRVAARAAAQRIAQENNLTLGKEVGYHVRFDRRLTDATRIRVLTEGILTRQLLSDPELPGIGCVILDEFHERSIHLDLCLALLAEVRASLRPDLKLLVMSATLDAGPVSKFLGHCPVLSVPGRLFDITTVFDDQPTALADLPARTARAVAHALDHDQGDILVFLPGAYEIDRVAAELSRLDLSDSPAVLPLHGSLPFEQQQRALDPQPDGRRRVILATNIAETSLTIDGVRVVIDTGYARQAGFDDRRGLDTLRLGRISKASARQRAGRAGRTAPGICHRLYTSKQFADFEDFDTPDIHRIDLAPTLLTLKAWGVSDPATFGFFDPPRPASLSKATSLLISLGAINQGTAPQSLSQLGKAMASVPAHPRVSRLLLEACSFASDTLGPDLAAVLSEEDFVSRSGQAASVHSGSSDLELRLHLLEQARASNFSFAARSLGIDPAAAARVHRASQAFADVAKQLRSASVSFANRSSGPNSPTHLALLAYPDRLAIRRSIDTATDIHGSGLVISPDSVVRSTSPTDYPLLLALDVQQSDRSGKQQATVRTGIALTLDDLLQTHPSLVKKETRATYDAVKDRVMGLTLTTYLGLVIQSKDGAPVSDEAAHAALCEVALPQASALLQRSEAARAFLARLHFVRSNASAAKANPPDAPSFPDPADPAYLSSVVSAALSGLRSLSALSDDRLMTALRNTLAYPLDRQLDEWAPTHFTVPTGNKMRIEYAMPDSPNQSPVLAVRLQELFGLQATPKLFGGKVPLVLHLLSPGYKPVQITSDLASFWKNTYAQVKKDLKVRYPKHSWPDDPLSAAPVAKGRPTRSS